MLTDWELRRKIVACGRRVYEKDLVAASDGNISVRVMGDRLLITPSGACLGELDPEAFVYADFQGRVLSGRAAPSTELPMHIEIYRARPDVQAVVHAHPPTATAFSVAGLSFSPPVLPEVVFHFGEIPIAPYATPSTVESARSIRSLIADHDVIVLDHHGAVAVGKNLDEALLKMEKLEHTAKTLFLAHQLGRPIPLPEEEVQKILNMRKG